jgi:hypothetical protein
MASRHVKALVLVLAVVALIAGKRLLYPAASLHAASLSSPAAQSYLIVFGVGETMGRNWDGSITATGSTILSLQGWRFGGTDSISGTASWKLATREEGGPPGVANAVQENGLIVTIAAPTGPVAFDVKTTQGNFNFSSQDLPFGISKSFLNGRALAAQTAAPFQLTSSTRKKIFHPSHRRGHKGGRNPVTMCTWPTPGSYTVIDPWPCP